MKQNNKKAQSFSTDILVVVIILLFGVLFLIANQISNKEDSSKQIDNLVDKASTDSRLLIEELKNSEIIDSNNNVDIENLKQVDIEKLKEELNIKSDFCIVFENEGKLVKVDSENNINGIGSENILINEVPCVSS